MSGVEMLGIPSGAVTLPVPVKPLSMRRPLAVSLLPGCPVTIEMVIAARDNPGESLRLYDRLVAYYVHNPFDPNAYGEMHHIVPRCMKGTDDPTNLVRLTAGAHFDAHLLLAQGHVGNKRVTRDLTGAVSVFFGRSETFAEIIASPKEMRLRRIHATELVQKRYLKNRALIFAWLAAGKPRPNKRSKDKAEAYLGQMLGNYIREGNCFRPGFKEELIARGADKLGWFPDHEATFESNKAQIFALLAAGKPRPQTTSKHKVEKYLAQALMNYLNENGGSFRPELKEQMIARSADKLGWFPDLKFESNRAQIFALLAAGKPRPSVSSKDKAEVYLARILGAYIDENGSCFRPGFKEELIARGADKLGWFPDHEATFESNKAQIFALLAAGKPRPNTRSKDQAEAHLARRLASYLEENGSCFRPGFKEELIARGADKLGWFPDHEATFESNKAQIFALLAAGKPRPNTRSKDKAEAYLAMTLAAYLNENGGSFRPELKEQMIARGAGKLGWFPTVTFEANRAKIFALLAAGKPRPSQRSKDREEAYLAQRLASYIDGKSASFRPGFKEEMIARGADRLGWFKKG